WVDGEVAASTDPNLFCVPMTPGAHLASFWYREEVREFVELGAAFYQTPNCAGDSSLDAFGVTPSVYGGWEQLTGALIAPPGTESATFRLGDSTGANFDDLSVDDAVLTTPTISWISPTSGPPGTTVDVRGVNFAGATNVSFNGTTASYTVDSDSEIHATV